MLKDTSSDEVLKAFHRVRENRPYLSHDLASEVAFIEARETTKPLRRMTVREAADACVGRRRQALRNDRRDLQHAPRADAHRHPAPAVGDGESAARLIANFVNRRRPVLLEAWPHASRHDSRLGSSTSLKIPCADEAAHKLHINCARFALTRYEYRPGILMQCSEKEWHTDTFHWRDHFSLANPLHLAIMSLQLGNEWEAPFHREFGNVATHSELGCDSS